MQIRSGLKSRKTCLLVRKIFLDPTWFVGFFQSKIKKYLKDVSSCAGITVSKTHAIELQKRGLPHINVLVNIAEDNQQVLQDTLKIDKIISAEIHTHPGLPPVETTLGVLNWMTK